MVYCLIGYGTTRIFRFVCPLFCEIVAFAKIMHREYPLVTDI